eukprot:TRINITY_DN77_c1_g1_i4.p1 TRINITY_DN77_c1_g1~~TRINITY_DN77_c1_g1_i4.p1  ORF type:complete len:327 (+),score=90.41 TRINITY_DN77_c1_g1_i4:455-1435(+)
MASSASTSALSAVAAPTGPEVARLVCTVQLGSNSAETEWISVPSLAGVSCAWPQVLEVETTAFPPPPMQIAIIDQRTGLLHARCEVDIGELPLDTPSQLAVGLQDCRQGTFEASVTVVPWESLVIPPASGTLQVWINEAKDILLDAPAAGSSAGAEQDGSAITKAVASMKTFSNLVGTKAKQLTDFQSGRMELYAVARIGNNKGRSTKVALDKDTPRCVKWNQQLDLDVQDAGTQSVVVTVLDKGLVSDTIIGEATFLLADLPKQSMHIGWLDLIQGNEGSFVPAAISNLASSVVSLVGVEAGVVRTGAIHLQLSFIPGLQASSAQ